MSDPDNIPDPVQLRSLAQNDYNIDGNLLPDGQMLYDVAQRIEQTQALLAKQAEHYAGMSLERWESLMKKVDADTASDADLTPGERDAGWHFCSLGWDGLLISPIDLEYASCGCPDKQHHKREPSYYKRLLEVQQWIKAEPRDYPKDFKEKFGEVP